MKSKRKKLLIFIVIIFNLTNLFLISEENLSYNQIYMNYLLKWRKENNLPPLPKLITLPSGIVVPELTLKTKKYPEVYWDDNEMIGATPFIARVLSEKEVEILIDLASEALKAHYKTRSQKYDMGFENASITDYYALALAEVYRHSGGFGPNFSGNITFVLIMKKDVNPSDIFQDEKHSFYYLVWPPGGMHSLTIERFTDGTFQVNGEGASG